MNTMTNLATLALAAGLAVGPASSACAAEAEATATVAYKQVHALTGDEGNYPAPPLVKGPDGYFYGAAESSGPFFGGTVFRMAANGTTQVLHAFGQAGDGAGPLGLTWGPDGHFYGVTSRGGDEDRGTFYRMTLDGAVTILHSFSEDQGLFYTPSHALMLSSDGFFYGTTTGGAGAIYRINTVGVANLMHLFEDFGAVDGRDPVGGLIEDSAGNLYGTTYGGGTHGHGTVFRLTKFGPLKTLHAFGSQRGDGVSPPSMLLRVGKMLYGVTAEGGARNEGTIYRISMSGTGYQQLHSFSSLSGAPYAPRSELAQGTDGFLYGTTSQGGALDKGTIYRIDLAGQLTQLYAFGTRRSDGTYPTAGLLPVGKSTFYGTTNNGGVPEQGTVYKLTVTD